MSKKKINKRLEHIFDDVSKEDVKPQKRPLKKTGMLSPSKLPPPLRPKAAPAKPAAPKPEESPVAPSAVTSTTGAMSLAFRKDEKNWATLRVVDDSAPRTWAMEEQMLVKQVADQLSLALENARLFQETQKAFSETESLYRANAELNASQTFDDIFAILRKYTILDKAHIGRLLQFDRPWNDQQTPDMMTLIADWPTDPSNPSHQAAKQSVKDYPAVKFLSPTEPTIVEDTATDERLDKNTRILLVERFKAKSALYAPLSIGRDWVGFLAAYYPVQVSFTKENLQRLMSLIGQAAIAIEKNRLFQEAQRRAREMAALAEVGQDVSASLDLQTVLERIATHAKDLLGSVSSAVYIPEPNGQVFRAIAVVGEEADAIKKDAINLGEGLLGGIAHSKKAEIINDALHDDRAVPVAGTEIKPYEHLMGAPLMAGDRVNGLMAVWRTGRGTEYQPSELDLVVGLSRQASIAIENARLFEETRESQKAVARSESELRALFAAMNDVIIVLDKEGRYERIAPTNPSRLFRPPEDMLGRKTSEVLPPETSKPIMAAIEQSIKTGETVKLEYSLDINQKIYWFDASVSKLNENQVFLVARDITERKYNELIQNAITRISEGALASPDMVTLLRTIHESVSTLMPARNFYVALYDERSDLMTFPY